MENNIISSVRGDAIIFMPLLEVLNLKHNQISDIDTDDDTSVWGNFPFLTELNVADNKIGTLGAFRNVRLLYRLRVLEVQNNPVFDNDRMTKLRYLLLMISRRW